MAARGVCVEHRCEQEWMECESCGGEGYSEHDCGEDCCCCADPENNVKCDICNGEGGYYACPECTERR